MGANHRKLCLVFALTHALSSLAQESTALRGRLSLPAKNWGVVLDLPGFTVKTVQTQADGRRYMAAENGTTHVVVSLTLEQVAPGAKSNSCRDALQKKSENPLGKVQDMRFSRSGDVDVLQCLVPKFNGQQVNQGNLFACQLYDDTYIDLHLSKLNFASSDETLFTNILGTMHIETLERSSKELFQSGSLFYLKHDYQAAIGPYSQALQLEKNTPTLEKPVWYVLVDNLGMSYGITGNLQKAKETFDYGVSKDPTYPMFYYNLACTYAELGNAAEAGNYLKKAFDNKANLLPGENMPDPRRDDSLKKIMKNKEFRELAESLARSR